MSRSSACSPEELLALRAIREARRRWGKGWEHLSPSTQTYQVYAQAFVLIATGQEVRGVTIRSIRRIHDVATAILRHLHPQLPE